MIISITDFTPYLPLRNTRKKDQPPECLQREMHSVQVRLNSGEYLLQQPLNLNLTVLTASTSWFDNLSIGAWLVRDQLADTRCELSAGVFADDA